MAETKAGEGVLPVAEPSDDWIDAKWHEACTTHGGRTQEFVRWFGRECLKAGREQALEEAAKFCDLRYGPDGRFIGDAIRARAGSRKEGV